MDATKTKSHGMIFDVESVRAILDGRKTQMRRVIKPALGPEAHWTPWPYETHGTYKAAGLAKDIPDECSRKILYCPWRIGEELYVKETFSISPTQGCSFGEAMMGSKLSINYFADGLLRDFHGYSEVGDGIAIDCAAMEWPNEKYDIPQPSSRMRQEYSRLSLRIASLVINRLHDINEKDAQAEGALSQLSKVVAPPDNMRFLHRNGFANLWDKINGNKHPWHSNPLVWKISFEKVGQ